MQRNRIYTMGRLYRINRIHRVHLVTVSINEFSTEFTDKHGN